MGRARRRFVLDKGQRQESVNLGFVLGLPEKSRTNKNVDLEALTLPQGSKGGGPPLKTATAMAEPEAARCPVQECSLPCQGDYPMCGLHWQRLRPRAQRIVLKKPHLLAWAIKKVSARANS